ncbi:hypothetical protein MSHOH_2681 [Methanosarcina horonobensis HB-1 = JCM 15518]|uniref:Uncharacterized protein n=1 Tax=Methanosarcina horonobensis HB-1 = JCM 15518 TaxID=1434110 RepID=A0A0E3SBF7_9EURY|nr:hypothetical protein [Methanosarcina horonobensis]AKB79164.1 hypothetical protein MSHOH_2681 [Methanosarcina horonobensis HB-1 = JCM 15518]
MKTEAEPDFLKPYCKTASSKTRIETIKNKGGKYIIRTEDDWDKKLKPDMKYYRGWHLIVLVVLMLVNAYMEIKWLFFS